MRQIELRENLAAMLVLPYNEEVAGIRRPLPSMDKTWTQRNRGYRVVGAGGAAGAPQFCVHFSGRANRSLIFFRYSGYIVSAPPSVASRGMPYNFVSSSIDGFVPGRKCGTFPSGTPS